MTEVALRAPTLEDAEAVAALINAGSRSLRGQDDVDASLVRGWWTQPPPFDRARDTVVAVRGNELVGYGDLGDQANDGAVLWLDIRGEAIAEVHAELERRSLGRLAADGVIRAVADERDAPYRALLEARGYRTIRASYRMGIELQGRDLEPSWPSGASVRAALDDADEPLLHELLERAFADHWGFSPTPYAEWRHGLREMGAYDPSLCFVVELHGAPVGAAVCRPREAGDPGRGWVSQLGVVREARGQGLGTALLTHAFAEFQHRGLERAGLGVDAESTTGAVRLYERAGMTILWRWEIWEKRP